MAVTLTIVEKGHDDPDGGELGKPAFKDIERDLVVGEDPVLQPGRVPFHNAVIVRVAPQADEEQARVPGDRRKLLVIPEFGLDHPRSGHRMSLFRKKSLYMHYVRNIPSGDKIFYFAFRFMDLTRCSRMARRAR